MIYNIQTSYKTYRSLCKAEGVVSIDRYVYFALCGEFMLYLSNVLLQGFKIKFPERLGAMQIIGNKQMLITDKGVSHKKVDWGKTKKLWEKNEKAKEEKKFVYFTNEHSKGYIYKLKWFKNHAVIPNKSIYGFNTSKNFRQKIAEAVRNKVEFLIMDGIHHVMSGKKTKKWDEKREI